jgi:hypothetical protein
MQLKHWKDLETLELKTLQEVADLAPKKAGKSYEKYYELERRIQGDNKTPNLSLSYYLLYAHQIEAKTPEAIANEFFPRISGMSISRLMKKIGIPIRNHSEGKFSKEGYKPDREELGKMYAEENAPAIARRLDITESTIYHWLREYKIEIRSIMHSMRLKRKLKKSA